MNRSSCLSKGGWVAFNVVLYLKSSLVRLSFGRNARTILEKWRHFGRRTILTMRATPPAHLPRSRRVAGSAAASQVVIRLKTEQILWEMKIPAFQVHSSVSDFRELKKPPRLQGQRKKQKTKKTIDFMSKTTARFLVHFLEVHWTATTSHLLMLRFMAELKIRRIIFFCLFEPR